MNGVNEKLQNLTKPTDFRSGMERDEQDLSVRQKTNASEDFCREARKGREQSTSPRAEYKSQEAQKRFKAQRQRDASRRVSPRTASITHHYHSSAKSRERTLNHVSKVFADSICIFN